MMFPCEEKISVEVKTPFKKYILNPRDLIMNLSNNKDTTIVGKDYSETEQHAEFCFKLVSTFYTSTMPQKSITS